MSPLLVQVGTCCDVGDWGAQLSATLGGFYLTRDGPFQVDLASSGSSTSFRAKVTGQLRGGFSDVLASFGFAAGVPLVDCAPSLNVGASASLALHLLVSIDPDASMANFLSISVESVEPSITVTLEPNGPPIHCPVGHEVHVSSHVCLLQTCTSLTRACTVTRLITFRCGCPGFRRWSALLCPCPSGLLVFGDCLHRL